MSGTLYVVATPIGNLEDITLRALRVLREVDVIAAEDTRHTAKLLNHYGIRTPTVSFHEHNTRRRVPEVLARLHRGESVALVSDAGTPVLADPGLDLVRACLDASIRVDPLPGPSAALAALVASGFPAEPVTFLGFAPSKANARKRWLAGLESTPHTVVFFEAPHRIAALLKDAASLLGNRPMVVGRELTKIHQEFLAGSASVLGERQIVERGEFTVVVGPKQETDAEQRDVASDTALETEFRHLTEIRGLTRRAAISELARKHRRPSREVYASLESAKKAVP